MFNITKLITISILQIDLTKSNLIGLIAIISFYSINATFVAISANIRYENCNLPSSNEIYASILMKVITIAFGFGIVLYFFGSFVFLPIIGFIMAIKVIKIRATSRKLTRHANRKSSSKKILVSDVKIMMSQIFVSNMAIIFQLPMAMSSVLNWGT